VIAHVRRTIASTILCSDSLRGSAQKKRRIAHSSPPRPSKKKKRKRKKRSEKKKHNKQNKTKQNDRRFITKLHHAVITVEIVRACQACGNSVLEGNACKLLGHEETIL